MNVKSESEISQSCPTLCNPLDCSLPGSSVHGIFKASVLEWGAIAFSVQEGRKMANFECKHPMKQLQPTIQGELRRTSRCNQTAECRCIHAHESLTMAKGTMPTRSFWLMKISDTAMSVVPLRGYSTCQVMGWLPERLLKLAISKFICTTSLKKLLLLEESKGKEL